MILLYPDDGDDEGAVGGASVLEEENALPGAEGGAALDDGDAFRRAGEGHAEVGGSVVRAFVGVCKIVGILGNQSLKICFQVFSGAGVRSFEDHKAGAGVLQENGNKPGACPAPANDALDL